MNKGKYHKIETLKRLNIYIYIYIYMFWLIRPSYDDLYLEVPLISMKMYHLELTYAPESNNLDKDKFLIK